MTDNAIRDFIAKLIREAREHSGGVCPGTAIERVSHAVLGALWDEAARAGCLDALLVVIERKDRIIDEVRKGKRSSMDGMKVKV